VISCGKSILFLLFKSLRRIIFHIHECHVHKCDRVKFFFRARRHIKKGFLRSRYVLDRIFDCSFEIECLNKCSFLQCLCITYTLNFDTCKDSKYFLQKTIIQLHYSSVNLLHLIQHQVLGALSLPFR